MKKQKDKMKKNNYYGKRKEDEHMEKFKKLTS